MTEIIKNSLKILCFGDSNTYGYDPRSILGEQYAPDARWVDIIEKKTGAKLFNEGVNGRTVPEKLQFFPEKTDLLIIMLGTNDLLQGRNAYSTAKKMEHFLLGLLDKREKLILIAPPAMCLGEWVPERTLIRESVKLGVLYKELASRLNIRFADAGTWDISLAFDGVHFTEEGHRAFAKGLLNMLEW